MARVKQSQRNKAIFVAQIPVNKNWIIFSCTQNLTKPIRLYLGDQRIQSPAIRAIGDSGHPTRRRVRQALLHLGGASCKLTFH